MTSAVSSGGGCRLLRRSRLLARAGDADAVTGSTGGAGGGAARAASGTSGRGAGFGGSGKRGAGGPAVTDEAGAAVRGGAILPGRHSIETPTTPRLTTPTATTTFHAVRGLSPAPLVAGSRVAVDLDGSGGLARSLPAGVGFEAATGATVSVGASAAGVRFGASASPSAIASISGIAWVEAFGGNRNRSSR
jgi:hypothetical protein